MARGCCGSNKRAEGDEGEVMENTSEQKRPMTVEDFQFPDPRERETPEGMRGIFGFIKVREAEG